jgi:predicted transcriptional regulator
MNIVHITFEADPEAADRASLALMRAAEARVRRGEPSEVVDTIAFESIEGMFSTLTPKRLALLQHLHAHPARSVRALAEALDRDYRRVHADVAALLPLGLIQQEGTALTAPYGEIRFALHLEAAA